MNTSILMGALTLILSAGFPEFAQTPMQPCGPTATEVFHLRGECEVLGKQFRDEVQATSTDPPNHGVGFVAHYDPQANHCYVRINDLVVSD
jgi:hypothetical protein